MDNEFKFFCYEEYYGSTEEVIRQIDECYACKAKLVFSHSPDYKNLVVQETARCLDCGRCNRKIIFIIN
jgi:hypothetical protein